MQLLQARRQEREATLQQAFDCLPKGLKKIDIKKMPNVIQQKIGLLSLVGTRNLLQQHLPAFAPAVTGYSLGCVLRTINECKNNRPANGNASLRVLFSQVYDIGSGRLVNLFYPYERSIGKFNSVRDLAKNESYVDSHWYDNNWPAFFIVARSPDDVQFFVKPYDMAKLKQLSNQQLQFMIDLFQEYSNAMAQHDHDKGCLLNNAQFAIYMSLPCYMRDFLKDVYGFHFTRMQQVEKTALILKERVLQSLKMKWITI